MSIKEQMGWYESLANDVCPCYYTTPCSDRCTCAHPHLSGGVVDAALMAL